MRRSIKVIVLEPDQFLAEKLREALEVHFTAKSFDCVANLTELLECHIREHYNLCLISDAIEPDTMGVFTEDYGKLGRGERCIFGQVRDVVPPNFDRTSLRPMGLSTVISRAITPADATVLELALKSQEHAIEVQNRIENVEMALKFVIQEIDRIASDKKRGRHRDVKAAMARFISGEASYDPEVLRKYFDDLIAETEKLAPPPEADAVEIPAVVLTRDMPHLSKDGYVGASDRVWKKLLKNFGVNRKKPAQNEPG